MDPKLKLSLTVIAATLGLAAGTLAAPASAAAPHDVIPSTPVTWCDAPSAAPCISSVTRAGSAITSSDSTWDISGTYFTLDGASEVQWNVSKVGAAVHDPATNENYSSMGPEEAGTAWSVTFDLGTAVIPRVTSTYGDAVDVTRVFNTDGTFDVTVAGNVVTQSANAECDVNTPSGVASCPVQASADVTYFGGEVSDFGQWEDAGQRNDFYGLDTWTNVEVTYIPPTINGDPLQIIEPLANSYKLATGAVFSGFYHVVIPNAFLVDMGIDDPSSIDPAGVDAQIGTGSVAVHPGASSVQVDATGITFPPTTSPALTPAAKAHAHSQQLKVKRGTITPKVPLRVKAKRSSAHKAKVKFGKVKPRGSKINGYQARCVAHHQPTRKGKTKHSPVTVKHLARGHTYKCQVRAKSKAGYGKWSKKDKA
ncbi:MAG: fibronectin type III domain-containing protein [Frankiaceae bacterium]|nr:fibronectin type III domain-containing protein [Frankiaceae bacterium]MBV9872320.1 fibronectin type III domain-containing protein [Frankiaceae bacterium]